MENTLTLLENWRYGHKSRSVFINADDGYGASCWTVKLFGHGKEVYAAETSFWEHKTIPENVVFVVDGNSDDDWPGLEAVILAAIKKAEELEL